METKLKLYLYDNTGILEFILPQSLYYLNAYFAYQANLPGWTNLTILDL